MAEKQSILRNEQIKHLIHNNQTVCTALMRFCDCTKEELEEVLLMRNKNSTQWTVFIDGKEQKTSILYGYKIFNQRAGKKTRTIKVPERQLKKVQNTMKNHLACIPVSLSATWWKTGDDFIKNAEYHKDNPYLITMDLKDAFPSVWTKRVYAVMSAALWKALSVWAPLLEDHMDKDLFVRAITHLLVHDNGLPQWASTSTQVMNIVLAKMDAAIEKKLASILPEFIYTRYIDDIAISFPHYQNRVQLQNQLKKYTEMRKRLHMRSDKTDAFEQLVNDFTQESFVVTDKYELSLLQEAVFIIKNGLQEYAFLFADDVYSLLIWQIDQRKQQITMPGENVIQEIKNSLLEVIWQNGFHAKHTKTRHWTPQSGGMREITWIAYTHDGKRWIPSAKRAAIQRFFNDMSSLEHKTLKNNTFYQQFFVDTVSNTLLNEKIINTLRWKYAYVLHVYWKNVVLKTMRESYEKAIVRRSWAVSTIDEETPYERENDNDLPF